jgi:hypothetical protein
VAVHPVAVHPVADLRVVDLRVVDHPAAVLRVVVHPAAVLRVVAPPVAVLRAVIHPAAVLRVVAPPVAILQAVVRQVALARPVVLRVVRVAAFPDSRFPASVARQWAVPMVTEILTVTAMARVAAVATPIAAGLACLAVSAAWAGPGNVVTVARPARVRLPTRPGAQVVKVLPAALVNILVKPMRSAPRVSAKSWTNQ